MPDCPLEKEEQKLFIRLFNAKHGKYKGRFVASANGAHIAGNGKQRAMKMASLKAQGFSNGFPDLLLPIARGAYNALYIEMKRQKGGTTSEAQIDWIEFLNAEGSAAVVCRGAEEALMVTDSYMSGKLCLKCWLDKDNIECDNSH